MTSSAKYPNNFSHAGLNISTTPRASIRIAPSTAVSIRARIRPTLSRSARSADLRSVISRPTFDAPDLGLFILKLACDCAADVIHIRRCSWRQQCLPWLGTAGWVEARRPACERTAASRAETHQPLAVEAEARRARRGMWAGTFEEPADWRLRNPREGKPSRPRWRMR